MSVTHCPLCPLGDDDQYRWQLISSAPRDGQWFLIANFNASPPEYEVGCYDPQKWWEFVDAGNGLFRREHVVVNEWRGFDNFGRATHWARIPHPLFKKDEAE